MSRHETAGDDASTENPVVSEQVITVEDSSINEEQRLSSEVAAALEKYECRRFSITLWVPDEQVGMVIGKGGNMIGHIRRETNTTIQILPQTDDGEKSLWAPVSIRGHPNSARAAISMVVKLVDEIDDAVAEFHLERTRHALIIGPKGSTIRRLSADSQVRIHVPSKRDTSSEGPPNNLISLEGSVPNVFSCLSSLLEVCYGSKAKESDLRRSEEVREEVLQVVLSQVFLLDHSAIVPSSLRITEPQGEGSSRQRRFPHLPLYITVSKFTNTKISRGRTPEEMKIAPLEVAAEDATAAEPAAEGINVEDVLDKEDEEVSEDVREDDYVVEETLHEAQGSVSDDDEDKSETGLPDTDVDDDNEFEDCYDPGPEPSVDDQFAEAEGEETLVDVDVEIADGGEDTLGHDDNSDKFSASGGEKPASVDEVEANGFADGTVISFTIRGPGSKVTTAVKALQKLLDGTHPKNVISGLKSSRTRQGNKRGNGRRGRGDRGSTSMTGDSTAHREAGNNSDPAASGHTSGRQNRDQTASKRDTGPKQSTGKVSRGGRVKDGEQGGPVSARQTDGGGRRGKENHGTSNSSDSAKRVSGGERQRRERAPDRRRKLPVG